MVAGLLLDADYETTDHAVVRLFFKGEKFFESTDGSFRPYFYAIPEEGKADEVLALLKQNGLDADPATKTLGVEKREVVRVFLNAPKDVPHARELVKEMRHVEDTREYDIPFVRRYLVDNGMFCMRAYDGKKEVEKDFPLKIAAFDIETYNPRGMPDAARDPAIMIGYFDGGDNRLFTWKKIALPFAVACADEEEMITRFVEHVEKRGVDVLMGYNSDMFDVPYLMERAKALGIPFAIGRNGEKPRARRTGLEERVEIPGRVHVDVFKMVEFLTMVGALRLPRYGLEDVYEEYFGRKKKMVEPMRMASIWETGGKELSFFAEYCLEDSEAAYRLGVEMLPLFSEFSRIIGPPLYDTTRTSASPLVEAFLIRKAFESGELVPKMAKETEVRRRMMSTYKGAFVREPERGLHEDIVDYDFRSMYPTIIMAHNIDPTTIDCACCRGEKDNAAPTGHWFCKKRRGLIPRMIEELVNERLAIKAAMKNATGLDKKMLNARQQAFKIVANATYGYLGFPRARWYSKECAEATAAWGREYIGKAMDAADAAGFRVLYADTDGFYATTKHKDVKESALEFLEGFNRSLPKPMELEFEGIFKRGIFVTKRAAKEGAKKKYALVDEQGKLKVVGFELVRRDVAVIAKRTQESVLEAVLRENDPPKAVAIVRKAVADLRAGRVPLDDLIIYTQLKKGLARYESIGPHVAAVQKAVKEGAVVETGTIIGFVVTKGTGSISERSYLADRIGDRKPDPEYYINNQVIPSVIRILGELGYSEEDLLGEKKQKGLGEWA